MPSGFSFLDRKHYFVYALMLLFFVTAVGLILWLGAGPQTLTDEHGSIRVYLWL